MASYEIQIFPKVYNIVEKINDRGRINTEKNTLVVAAVWGRECIQFLAALAVFHYRTSEE